MKTAESWNVSFTVIHPYIPTISCMISQLGISIVCMRWRTGYCGVHRSFGGMVLILVGWNKNVMGMRSEGNNVSRGDGRWMMGDGAILWYMGGLFAPSHPMSLNQHPSCSEPDNPTKRTLLNHTTLTGSKCVSLHHTRRLIGANYKPSSLFLVPFF
jgi:hypothetical protein